MESKTTSRQAVEPDDPPELAFIGREHRLLTKRFRQYARVAKTSPDGAGRLEMGLPLRAFAAKYEGRREKERTEIITPILHGTLDVPTGPAELRDVDDTDTDSYGQPARRGRPGAILDKVFSLRYLPDSSTASITEIPPIRVSSNELRDVKTPQWPDRAGIHGEYAVRDLAAVVDLISAMSRSVRPRTVYAKTGVLRRPGKPDVWLRFGGPALMPTGSATITDETARAELHPEYESIAVLRELSYSLPSTDAEALADLAALFSVTEVYPETPELPVALISELGWAPSSSDNGRVTVAPFGDSGEAGKTSIMDALIVSAQSAAHQASPDVEGIVFNCRNKGTALGLDQAMHPARGSIVASDDIITRHMSPAELTKGLTRFDGIADGIATGTGSPRGGHNRGRSTFSVNRAPTGCGVVTAEDIPGEDRLISLMGRVAAISITNPADVEHWSKTLRAVQDDSRAIGRAHSRFITDHLAAGLAETAQAAVDEYRPVVAAWQHKHGGHKRTINTYARLAAGWVLYARHEARLSGGSIDAAPRIAYGLAHLESMFRAQAARSGKVPGARPVTDAAELFVRNVADVLAGGPGSLYVADAELSRDGTYQAPRGLPVAAWPGLGWRARQVPDGTGGRETVWEPVSTGPPVGAVIIRDPAGTAAGRPPCYDMRLLMRPAELDKLTAVAASRALKGPVPLILSGGAALRNKLAAAHVLASADAEKQNPVWAETGKQRRYVLDLAPIMAGTLGHGDPEPEPYADPDLNPEPEPSPAGEPVGLADVEPAESGWEPGTNGAAANPDAEPATPAEPGPALQPAVAAEPAESLSGPPLPEEPPEDGYGPPGPGRTPGGHTVRSERARTRAARKAPGREPMPHADRLANFTRAARLHFPDADARDILAGLDVFERTLGGLRFEGSPALVGVLAFHWLQEQYGSVPELARADTLETVAGLKVRRGFTVASPAALDPAAAWAIGTDVNAQFLAAGETAELGTGLPKRITDVGPEYLKMPGYAWLDGAGLPGPFTAIKPGECVPMPIAKLAAQWAAEGRCPEPVFTEALVWPQHRRWLRLLSARLKDGRAKLITRPDMPGRIAMDIVKQVYSGMYGGMLRSQKHNRTGTLRPDWADMVRGTGTANMWRALVKASPAPVAVVDPDAAYFTVASQDAIPAGLTYSEHPVLQPGKWKVHRSCPLTDDMRAAISAGKPTAVRDLFRAGHEQHSGSAK